MAKYRGVLKDASGNAVYPEPEKYFKGDSITFSNSGLQQYTALWSSTSQLRAVIPLDRPVDSDVTGFTVTGAFIAHSNNGYATYTISSSVEASAALVTGGIGLQFVFSSAQSIAAANSVATFQPQSTFKITLT